MDEPATRMPGSVGVGTPVANRAMTTIGGRVRRSWYAERPVTGPAGRVVACAWRGLPGWARRIRLLPDGCVDLVWDGTGVTVTPAVDRAVRIGLRPGGVTVGVRLHPYAAVAVLGRPVPYLDGPVLLDDLWPRDAVDRLTGALRTSAASAHLIRAVTARVPRHPPDPLVAAVVHRLAAGAPTVEAAARAIGASDRTVRRRVRADTGLAPKRLHEILRLRRALDALPANDLARTALDAGYYDQAHLNRQVRALTGTTPGALAAARAPRRADGGRTRMGGGVRAARRP